MLSGKEEEARVHQHMQMVAQKQVRFSSPGEASPPRKERRKIIIALFLFLAYSYCLKSMKQWYSILCKLELKHKFLASLGYISKQLSPPLGGAEAKTT